MNTSKEAVFQEKTLKERILQPRTLFYLSGIIILILYHMRFELAYGDAVGVYGDILKRGSEYFPQDGNVLQAIYNFTVYHYLSWSSRNIIEAVLLVLAAAPAIVWHVLDIGTVILIGYCLDRLVCIKDARIKYLSIFSFLMMYYPATMYSAGWIATTTNYSWVMAMGLYVYLNMQRIRKGEHVSRMSYALALLAGFYAMNQEQMCGMLLLLSFILSAKDIWDKKFKKALIPFIILNLAELMWILLCPGNAARKLVETTYYLPIYEGYSLPHKVYEGICCLLQSLFHPDGVIIIVFFCLLLLAYLIFKQNSPIAIKAISLISVLYTVLRYTRRSFFYPNYRESPAGTAVGCVVLLCILITCYYATRGMKEQAVFLGALCSGAATKVVLGFSVAFHLSGERTSIFLAFTLILASLFLIEKQEHLFRFLRQKKFVLGLVLLDISLFLWNYNLIVSGRII